MLFKEIKAELKYMKVINDSDRFINIDLDAFRQKLSEGSDNVLVYIGRPSCTTCKAFIEMFDSALIQEDKHVYYLDLDSQPDKSYVSFLNQIGITSTPAVIKITGEHKFSRMRIYHPTNAIKLWLEAV